MPFGDRTGPAGAGPMTGRAMGYCAGYPVPGYMNPYPGRFLGRFWCLGGRGRGYRWWWKLTGLPFWARWGYPQSYPFHYGLEPEKAKEAEIEFIKAEARNMEKALEEVRKRIEEIERKEK